MSPQGQHIELGIAESNLFLQLAALGLAGPLFGTRLLPIGTLYDPFIKRWQDCAELVGDFHPATLSWLGAAAGNAIVPLGVDRFGRSGDIPDLYRAYGIDTDAILDAAAHACLTALR
jgi:pyruvate dehydrogenase complex dehydrogenase (E1) component